MRWRLRSLAIVVWRRRADFCGRGRGLPEIEQPFRPKIVFEFEHRWKIAPELLAQAIGESVALGAEVLGDARPLAQFDDARIGSGEQPEAARIGAQSRGHDFSVAAVVLGAGEREPVTKTVHLFRVDGVNFEAALDQGFDHGAMRHLNRDLDLTRLRRAAGRHQPGCHLGEPLAAVLEASLGDSSDHRRPSGTHDGFPTPVDAGVPFSLISHGFSSLRTASHRDLRRSLYWRSDSGVRVRRGLPTGPRSRPIRRGTRPPQVVGPQGAIGCSRRDRLGLARLRQFGPSPAGHATFRYASLRATCGVHPKNRMRGVQGGDSPPVVKCFAGP